MPDTIEMIEKLIAEGRFLEARAKAGQMIDDSNNLRVQQLLALAMAKSGAPKAALDFLEPQYKQHPDDPETSGILGSIYKELFKETKNNKYAVLSRDTYLNNFKLTGNSYTGINAASMSAISGSMSKAKDLAKEIIASLSAASTDIWELASLAEANLLVKEKDKAVDLYFQCRQLLGSDWGRVSSIYNQLWLLNHYVPVSTHIMSIFSPPAIAAFVGHMVDHPTRTKRRFPASVEQEVKQVIAGTIKSINAKIGYCSLACGSDILFAEAMAETGGEVNVFLPFDRDDFLNTSVSFAGEHWVSRFETLTANFKVNYITTERYLGCDDLFVLQSHVIFGAALHRAAMLHSSPNLITVYSDVDIRVKKGGTHDTVKYWPPEEKRININPQHFIKDGLHGKNETQALAGAPESIVDNPTRHVRFLVSLDMRSADATQKERLGYQIGKIAEELKIDEMDQSGATQLFAFRTIEECTSAAWRILKLTPFTSVIKVSLHAGPVDTNEQGTSISGPSIDVIRKVHEYAMPGKAYSTFPFAAVVALLRNKFAVQYAGIIRLNENETAPIFQVNRHEDAFDL